MNKGKRSFLSILLGFVSLCIMANDADPVLMIINGKEIKRSEFEYALNKNNATLGDNKKAVKEYLPMYIDFKLKVAEAEAQRLDTLSSFIEELKSNRAQLAENYLTDPNFVEREAHSIYAKDSATIGADGFLNVQHIVILLRQGDTEQVQAEAKARIDSAYAMLKNGEDFIEVGKKMRVQPATLNPIEIIRGQAYKEFETVAYSLKDGEFSAPFRSPAGYHIVRRNSSRPFGQFQEYREAIIKMLERNNIRALARQAKGVELAKEFGGGLTPEEAIAREDSLLESKYPEFANLMREYYDGLLFFEVCNREVWEKSAKDVAGMEKFFKKNKKRYKFDTPRYRGAIIHANSDEDIAKAKELLSNVSSDKYKDVLKENFYVDSLYTIRLEVGVFAIGDNAWVDKFVFEQGEGGKLKPGFTKVDVVGTIIEKPETYKDVRGLVTNDYQKYLEEKWVKTLRKKYSVEYDKEVLKTVNNHN